MNNREVKLISEYEVEKQAQTRFLLNNSNLQCQLLRNVNMNLNQAETLLYSAVWYGMVWYGRAGQCKYLGIKNVIRDIVISKARVKYIC